MKSGVYTIENILTGKIYVGCTTNIKARRKSHFNKLKVGKHCNIYLQRAVNKYGIENFVFEVLEECEEQFIYSQEHYWCNLLNTHNPVYGYNDKPTNPYNSPRLKQETKDKIGAIHKGKKISIEQIERVADVNRIKVCQYSIDGRFIALFDSIQEAKKRTGVVAQNISNCCNKVPKYRTAGGYRWEHFNNEIKQDIGSLTRIKHKVKRLVQPWTGKTHTKETKDKMSRAMKKVKEIA